MRGSPVAPLLGRIDAALADHGLRTRGALHEDGKTIVLIGHAGSSIWPHFSRWRGKDTNGEGADPLDRWSRAVIGPVAALFGATALFPSEEPYMPFQRWAMEAEGLRPSPLGILVHPEYGLWHAYRGALAFDADFEPGAPPARDHPCSSCRDKPCLTVCPVAAFDGEGFAVQACRSFLASDEGAPCLSGGCAARLACPVGRGHAYHADQQRFHMLAFASS